MSDTIKIKCRFKGVFLPWTSYGLLVLPLLHLCLCLCLCGICMSVCVFVCLRAWVNHKPVRAISYHSFKQGSQNLDQRCKTTYWISRMLRGGLDIELQRQIQLENQILSNCRLEVYPCNKSSPVQAKMSKFRPEVRKTLVPITDFLFIKIWTYGCSIACWGDGNRKLH